MRLLEGNFFDEVVLFDRNPDMSRLAKLAGGVAVIKVGGATEVEVKEKKDRVDFQRDCHENLLSAAGKHHPNRRIK